MIYIKTLPIIPSFMLKMIKVRVPFVQTLCIEKDSYMDAI